MGRFEFIVLVVEVPHRENYPCDGKHDQVPRDFIDHAKCEQTKRYGKVAPNGNDFDEDIRVVERLEACGIKASVMRGKGLRCWLPA